MKKNQFKGVFILLLTAFIWGSSFAAQSIGMKEVEAFTFNGIRTLMGAATLLPYILVRDLVKGKKLTPEEKEQKKEQNKKALVPGIVLGLVLFVASNLQQQAFNYTASGKIAFITAFYMLFVPIIGIAVGKRIKWPVWFCVILGVAGLYFLCIGEGGFSGINRGDVLTLACAVVYAVHILAIEKYSYIEDSIRLSCTQFIVSGAVTAVCMLIFEHPDPSAISTAIPSLLYSGVLSCGLAYTFQIVGQKYTESTVASLLMCMESVFGVITSAIVLREMLSPREITGCVLMFTAIILSQFSDKIALLFSRTGVSKAK